MATGQESARDATERLSAEIAKLREELAEIAARVRDGVAPSARDAARAAARAAASSVSDLGEKAREYGEATVTSAKEQVRAHPLAAVGVAFALGAVAALLLRR
jgi:ElaB/YqjD/DUF883 family membrane-anchored ribosome-binding protein